MIKYGIKNLFYYTIKFDVLLVYTFSRTPFFVVWLFLLILGLFGGKSSNLVNLYCLFIVAYLTGTANFLFILSISKKTKDWVTTLVGVPFLEKYVPNKGFSNLLILQYPILLLFIIEIASLEYQTESKLQESANLYQTLQNLSPLDDQEKASEIVKKQIEIFESISFGLISKLASHPYMLYLRLLLSRIFGL